MAILLALLSAGAYGTGDFAAGMAARRYASGTVTLASQGCGLIAAGVALLFFAGSGPATAPLLWGALSGVGSAIGTFALYHGLSVGRMSVVATLSAVLTAVIPVLVGLGLGDHLSVPAAVGIIVAVPAIALVSWQPEHRRSGGEAAGALYGALAGLGFALLLIALDKAGTRSGAWPLVPGQGISVLLLLPAALRGIAGRGRPDRSTVRLMLGAGVLTGSGNLLFLAATGHGELAVVAVLTSLYPAMTVILARLFLAEHWTPLQVTGLLSAVLAVVLVSLH